MTQVSGRRYAADYRLGRWATAENRENLERA
jgi:hypothetical protein